MISQEIKESEVEVLNQEKSIDGSDQTLSKSKKKKLKKKAKEAAAKVEKNDHDLEEIKEEEAVDNVADYNSEKQDAGEDKSESQSKEDNFASELDWCIKQLKLGLERNNVTKEQLAESIKVIQVLESKTAPLVKKRHLMKVVFGDYRTLMKQIKQCTKQRDG